MTMRAQSSRTVVHDHYVPSSSTAVDVPLPTAVDRSTGLRFHRSACRHAARLHPAKAGFGRGLQWSGQGRPDAQ